MPSGFMQYLTPEDRTNAALLSFTTGMMGGDGVQEAMGFVGNLINLKREQEKQRKVMAAERDTRGFLSAWMGGNEDYGKLVQTFPEVDVDALGGFAKDVLEQKRHVRNLKDQIATYAAERRIDQGFQEEDEARKQQSASEYGQAMLLVKKLREEGMGENELLELGAANPALGAVLDDDIKAQREEEKIASELKHRTAMEQAAARRAQVLERLGLRREAREARRLRLEERRVADMEKRTGLMENKPGEKNDVPVGDVADSVGIMLRQLPELTTKVRLQPIPLSNNYALEGELTSPDVLAAVGKLLNGYYNKLIGQGYTPEAAEKAVDRAANKLDDERGIPISKLRGRK